MARDYAKRSRRGGKAATRSRRASAKPAPRVWRWYASGVLSGVVLSLGLYLVTLPPAPGETGKAPPEPQPKTAKSEPESPPKPRFDFYTMLPEQSIDVEVGPAEVAQPRAAARPQVYILQAGSFRQREDADRRRAELLLLGLEPSIEESSGGNGRWFRVFLGPFESRSLMARARSLTAGQDIDTLLLKREG